MEFLGNLLLFLWDRYFGSDGSLIGSGDGFWIKQFLFNLSCTCLCRNLSDVLWEAISTRQFFSLYQGLGTKNLQSFIAQFVYFYGYSYFKRLYLEKSGNKSIGTKANLVLAAAAGACTSIVTQVMHIFILFWA